MSNPSILCAGGGSPVGGVAEGALLSSQGDVREGARYTPKGAAVENNNGGGVEEGSDAESSESPFAAAEEEVRDALSRALGPNAVCIIEL